jgi:hypothetical protein
MRDMKVTDVTFENWNEAFNFGAEVRMNPNVDVRMVEYPPTDEIERGWTCVTIEHCDEDTILIQNTARTYPILNVQTFNLHTV